MENLIRKKRKEKGISRQEMAKILGVVPSTITLYEQSKRTPPIDKAHKIATILDITLEELAISIGKK